MAEDFSIVHINQYLSEEEKKPMLFTYTSVYKQVSKV